MMGRKPLNPEHLQNLTDFAKGQGFEGFSRAEAITAGVVAENRWALLRDRGMRQGTLIKKGWKKSARYFHVDYSERPEEIPFMTEMPETETVETDDVDDDFQELSAPFETVETVESEEQDEDEFEYQPQIEDWPMPEEYEKEDNQPEFDVKNYTEIDAIEEEDDEEELDAIIESLEVDNSVDEDIDWDFDF